MSPLGQTEAFDPAPTRRLLVPDDHCGWIGIDPSTQRVAVASIAADGRRGVSTASFPASAGGQRLSAIYDGTRDLVEEIAAMVKPGVIVVEQPSGARPNPSLSYAVGVTMAAAFDGVAEVTGHGVLVETVTSSSWKKIAIGAGNAYKPKSGRVEEYAVWRWARDECDYEGRSIDEVDAMGIAEYARKTFQLEVR